VFCESRDKPKLEYPCEWEYRVIGDSAEALRGAVSELLGAFEYALENGNRKGKWLSLSVKLTVKSEEERDELHRRLNAHPAVRMVF